MWNITEKFYYSGIGSRETPDDVAPVMTWVASDLESRGYVLRSGGAPGADTYFEDGVKSDSNKEIYLPFKNFRNHPSPLHDVCDDALQLASEIHPAWDNCRRVARLLHARNCYQVLGKDLNTPAKFVICWTQGGIAKGGTRTAIKLAERFSIPVLNFGSYPASECIEVYNRFMTRYDNVVVY